MAKSKNLENESRLKKMSEFRQFLRAWSLASGGDIPERGRRQAHD
jgi:hypothetical protein